jgi:hypothetical protein
LKVSGLTFYQLTSYRVFRWGNLLGFWKVLKD